MKAIIERIPVGDSVVPNNMCIANKLNEIIDALNAKNEEILIPKVSKYERQII